ncbi:hypothetical protein HPB50_023146 [Hyalomma asiaticum]|uniref:Uncharacterized protein n=1 Tax=Hyalomma asiaticum TaxID=266040 RepID=A0ACB7TQ70_HYAAI|nr:hypothetical protein HPB50_023146 [Hyalomma asiaticum]
MMNLELPSKRAIAMEKRHATRNEIEEIEFNGRITKEKTEIEQVFYEHYCRLFSYNVVDINNFKREFLPLMPRLDDATKDVLELPISEDEVRGAIDKLNLGKSPGPDAIITSLSARFARQARLTLAATRKCTQNKSEVCWRPSTNGYSATKSLQNLN